jgi:predicted dehydrogenase
LEAGKHVFVEKPLALDAGQLETVTAQAAGSSGTLMVGFNRRFAPFAVRLRESFGGRGPLVMTYRVSAGRLPASHWTHDPVVGGGRIVGEVCHFVDLLAFLSGGQPEQVTAVAVGGGSELREDSVAATITFSDGSIGQIVYSALGDPGLAKERVEVMGEAGAGVLDDFRELRLYRGGQEEQVSEKRDKGHDAELAAFVQGCETGVQQWPIEEMAAVMRATFAIRDAIRVPSGDGQTP